MTQEINTTVRVTVSLEIKITAGWGKDCTVREIVRQAHDEGMATLAAVLDPDASPLSADALAGLRDRVFVDTSTARVAVRMVQV